MLGNLGPLELSIVAAVGLALMASMALTVWAIVDIAFRPGTQWAAAGQSKGLWIVLIALGSFVIPIGLAFAIGYLAWIRPKLRSAGGMTA
jgi:hypothetical protein